MAGTNNFLVFGANTGANVIDQVTYSGLASRSNGFSSGVASSAQLNKVWRQGSAIANAIGQYIADQGYDALDNGDAATLLANLKNALAVQIDAQSGNFTIDTGAANAYVVAVNPPITSYPDGMTLRFRATNANTGASTLNAGAGAVPLRNNVDGALVAGDIPALSLVTVTYIAALGHFVVNTMVPSQSPSSVSLTRSQTVLNGTADANGYAAFFTAGSGLACNLVVTTPITVAFAAGYGTNGLISYIGVISASVTAAWSGLTASQTSYLYIDRNSSTGALTYGASLLAPVYQDAAPSSPATDQHWFSPLTMTMQRWSGSAWVAVQRVFVGRAIAGASSITGVTVYAFNGRYLSQPFAVAYSASSVVTHALGVQPRVTLAYLINVVSDLGYGVGNRVLMPYADNTSSVCSLSSDTLNGSFNLSSGGLALPQIGTGTRGGITTASWNVQTYFDRGW